VAITVQNFAKIGQMVAKISRFFFKMLADILDFQIPLILTTDELWGPTCITVPNFNKIGQAVVEIL